MRIALAANRASGGGLDPEPLAAAMRERGAEVAVFGCEDDELERSPTCGPERVAVAGGDGTIGPAAELAGRLGVPLASSPPAPPTTSRAPTGCPRPREAAAALAAEGDGHPPAGARPPGRRPAVRERRQRRAGVGRRAQRASRSSRGSGRWPTGSARCARGGRGGAAAGRPCARLERYLSAADKISRLAVGTASPFVTVDSFRIPDDRSQERRLPGLPFGTRGGIVIDYTFPQDAEYALSAALARDLNEGMPVYPEAQVLEISVDRERVAT